jgi:superfamily II DNA/RNA helicase
MGFKKINEQVAKVLEKRGWSEPIEQQKAFFSAVKSGRHIVYEGARGTGKSTGLLIAAMHILKMEPQGDNARLLIFAPDKEAVLNLVETYQRFAEDTELRIFPVFEGPSLNKQRDLIYPGADVVIGTPKAIVKLYFHNGLNLMSLQTVAVEDADTIKGLNWHTEVQRIMESVPKSQRIILQEKKSPKTQQLIDESMLGHQKV